MMPYEHDMKGLSKDIDHVKVVNIDWYKLSNWNDDVKQSKLAQKDINNDDNLATEMSTMVYIEINTVTIRMNNNNNSLKITITTIIIIIIAMILITLQRTWAQGCRLRPMQSPQLGIEPADTKTLLKL